MNQFSGKHAGRWMPPREIKQTVVWLLTVAVLILVVAVPEQAVLDYVNDRGGVWQVLSTVITLALIALVLLASRGVMWLFFRNEVKQESPVGPS